jgi:hypothetical protein
LLPDGKERSGFAAADGQMGQIIHAYMDWRLSGGAQWLRKLWPRIKKALEFPWIPGGWDADKDGVLEGVQHNTTTSSSTGQIRSAAFTTWPRCAPARRWRGPWAAPRPPRYTGVCS